MKNKKEPLIGVVDTNGTKFNFLLENYRAIFMSLDNSFIDLHGEFVYGRTNQYHDIAIYKGEKDIRFSKSQHLNTSAYVISTSNMSLADLTTFDSIEFRGGTLNKVFFCHALKQSGVASSPNNFYYDAKSDCETYEFETEEGICKVTIGSAINEHFGIDGVSFSNNTVRFILEFDAPQNLISLFDHISKIKEMLALLTFRKNVGFDEIYIHRGNVTDGLEAQVFLKESISFTEKGIMNSITFHDVKEAIPKILYRIYYTKDNEPSYDFGFLPSSDNDVFLMTNNKIRMICSALECELSFIPSLCLEESEDLRELIKNVKKTIKDYRKGANRLSAKTYDLIFSSIDHWSMSASDKFCELYHQYEEELLVASANIISDDSIAQLVKYRNKITHGSYRVMDSDIAATAYVLSGLVYCAFLTRVGVSKENILRLCQEHKLLR